MGAKTSPYRLLHRQESALNKQLLKQLHSRRLSEAFFSLFLISVLLYSKMKKFVLLLLCKCFFPGFR